MFLLYGHLREQVPQLLQRLTMALSGINRPNYLQVWARKTPNWQHILIEALAIIRANHILRRLGLDLDYVHVEFSPTLPDIQTRIHPIVKWLHYLCEQLKPAETRLLIDGITDKFPQHKLRNNTTPIEPYLEMWLLMWMSPSTGTLVDVGTWSFGEGAQTHCRLDDILQAMKTSSNERLLSLYDRLKQAQVRFNHMAEFQTMSNTHILTERTLNGQPSDGDTTLMKSSPANANHPEWALLRQRSVGSMDEVAFKDRYRMRSDRVGYALIINMEKFHVTEVHI